MGAPYVLNISWEYPPWVVGDLSYKLKATLPTIAKRVPLAIVVRGDYDSVSEIDGMKLYVVAQSLRAFPQILSQCHTLNIDLIRGASKAIHEIGRPALINTHDWVSSIAGVYLNAHFGVPLAVSVYSTEVMRSDQPKSLLSMGIYDIERHCFRAASILIADSPEVEKSLEGDYGIRKEKIALSLGASSVEGVYRRYLP
uniref:Glycosyltransferase subfamily 4-like N-terminal domain-containing protein n=1 Tax=Candidatus Methanomethylicus mesodigestus TaxID=1867258 RepID=A0A7C3IKW4_9CREN